MAQKNEKTWGARLQNANTIVTLLNSYGNYKPYRTKESIASLQTLITEIEAANTAVTRAQAPYKAAVQERKAAFDTIKRLLSPILGTAKASFGKTASETVEISKLITKIRGEKPSSVSVTDVEGKTTTRTVSQSETSFGSIAANFNSIVAVLEQKDKDYEPANPEIEAAALRTLYNNLANLSQQVTITLNQLTQAIKTRADLYKDLADRIQQVKNAVKGQYTISSSEYKGIKGLQV